MAKSLRSKKKKRLRTLRREIAQPFYDKKDAAKLAVQEAALAAPKLDPPPSKAITASPAPNSNMDVEMDGGAAPAEGAAAPAEGGAAPAEGAAEGGAAPAEGAESFLKPVGSIGKKWKMKLKLKKDKRHKKKNKMKLKF